jgi:D-alanyl-D-alanine carboxypeptidase
MMTARAHALGMKHSVFRNASGLPDPDQFTTARDMATLARHLVTDFPTEYRYFSTREFRFHRRVIPSHDHLLETYAGADGLKTGYTAASGFNLVTSAVRSDVRLVGVVLGAARAGERDVQMAELLNQGFDMLDVPNPGPPARHEQRLALIPQANAATPGPSTASLHQQQRLWAVQVGAFTSEAAAKQAATAARRLADDGEIRIESAVVHGKTTWRAMLVGLSQSEANGACGTLAKRKLVCAVVHPEQRQIASR